MTPIPLPVSDETHERFVANIIYTYGHATQDQWERGKTWYHQANQLAAMISGGDVVTGAGVIAALSSNKRWSDNTKLAARAFLRGEPSGHVGDALTKAARIMAGERPTDVLPMSSKTGQFFLCIANPADPQAVCVDRHAHDVAVGVRYGSENRGLSSKARYQAIADAYRDAARRLDVLPLTVQAVCWVVQIESSN
ncbi:DUF7178 family protein [Nonomuraea sp. SYSU D8015]|uniref:DUF7178 family protein n=1 Tax=Nonomuraea sp. SYSU D8015 TaxID=2593644 RepID=UPI001CB6FB8D|nr:hypothetical protein [Nonomuraea sp. SYSU D8015]